MILDLYDLDEEQWGLEIGIVVLLLISLFAVFFQIIANKSGPEL